MTCLSSAFCNCPSSYQTCKHLAFLRLHVSTPASEPQNVDNDCMPGIDVMAPAPMEIDLPPPTTKWEQFQSAIKELGELEQGDLSDTQLSALVVGARNLVAISKSGCKQPELYRLRRSSKRKVLEKKGTPYISIVFICQPSYMHTCAYHLIVHSLSSPSELLIVPCWKKGIYSLVTVQLGAHIYITRHCSLMCSLFQLCLYAESPSRSYVRTRRPLQKKRGVDGRVKLHKRQHKQTRLRKASGLTTIEVSSWI